MSSDPLIICGVSSLRRWRQKPFSESRYISAFPSGAQRIRLARLTGTKAMSPLPSRFRMLQEPRSDHRATRPSKSSTIHLSRQQIRSILPRISSASTITISSIARTIRPVWLSGPTTSRVAALTRLVFSANASTLRRRSSCRLSFRKRAGSRFACSARLSGRSLRMHQHG